MFPHADDRDANPISASSLPREPSKGAASPLSTSSQENKKRQWSKLGTAPSLKKSQRQSTRSSRGLSKKVPDTQDSAQSGTTQRQPQAVLSARAKEPRAKERDAESTASDDISGATSSHEPIVAKSRRSGISDATRPGSPSKVHLRSSISSLRPLPVSADQHKARLSPKPHLHEHLDEVDRLTASKSFAKGEQTTNLAGAFLEAPHATTPSLAHSTTQDATSSASQKPHDDDDTPHEAPEHITKSSYGASTPSAAATLISTAKYPSLITSAPRDANATDMFGANWWGRTSRRREDVRDSMNSSKLFTAANADVDPGGGQPTDGAVNHDHEGAPTIISASAMAPFSETAGHVTAMTDQQPETALREMARLPSLLDRLLNPFRKRAHFGTVTLRVLTPRSTPTTSPSPLKIRSSSFSTVDKWPQVAVATILVAATVLAVYSLFRYTGGSGGGGTSGGGPALCQTADCVRHAYLFADRLNASIDPCEDFAAFACSAWTYGTPYRRDDVTSMRQEIVLRFTENFAGTIATGLT